MEQFYFSPFTLVALVPIVVEAFKHQFKWKDKVLFTVFKHPIAIAQIVSMGIAILLSLIGFLFKLGFFVEMHIFWTIAWGFLIGFAASGMFAAGYLEIIYSIINNSKTK